MTRLRPTARVWLALMLVVGACGDSVDVSSAGTDVRPGDARVRISSSLSEQSGPPFYVEVGDVQPGDDAWGHHDLLFITEWRSPIGIEVGTSRVELEPGASRFTMDQDFTVIQPGEEVRVAVELAVPGDPQPGVYKAVVEVPYWRDLAVGVTAAPGLPDGVYEFSLTYELLTAQQISERQPFCDTIVPLLANGPSLPDELRPVLETIDAAALDLVDERLGQLVSAVEELDDVLRRIQEGDSTVSSWSTHEIVSLVNEICGTDLLSSSVQS